METGLVFLTTMTQIPDIICPRGKIDFASQFWRIQPGSLKSSLGLGRTSLAKEIMTEKDGSTQ